MSSSKPRELTLIVPVVSEVVAAGSIETMESDYEDEFEQQSLGGGAFVRRLLGRAEKIDLDKLRGELEDVQAQVDELLASIYERTVGGMQLSQVQVSLTISAEGSIGIASAGAQASIALVYERRTDDRSVGGS